jgi:hypothetical protein
MHEWHHLIAAARRLEGPHPSGLADDGVQLRLKEADPWLGEGFAEWATDETLRDRGPIAALLRFNQAEKRWGIATGDGDDPHVLGYNLVEAAARRTPRVQLRDALVEQLDDIAAAARTLRLDSPVAGKARTLSRPVNAAVIPEISFTWDEGLAFDVSRRLVIPKTNPPER